MKFGGADILKTLPNQVDVERLGLGMIFAGHPFGEGHVPPKLIMDLSGGPRLVVIQDLQRRIVVDVQEFVKCQRLGILPRPVLVGRIGAGELGFDEDQVTAGKMKHDVGLRARTLDGKLRLEPLTGGNQEFHRVKGVVGKADSPEIKERFDRAGVAGDGPCEPAQATGLLERTEDVPRHGIFGTFQPKPVRFVLERMTDDPSGQQVGRGNDVAANIGITVRGAVGGEVTANAMQGTRFPVSITGRRADDLPAAPHVAADPPRGLADADHGGIEVRRAVGQGNFLHARADHGLFLVKQATALFWSRRHAVWFAGLQGNFRMMDGRLWVPRRENAGRAVANLECGNSLPPWPLCGLCRKIAQGLPSRDCQSPNSRRQRFWGNTLLARCGSGVCFPREEMMISA